MTPNQIAFQIASDQKRHLKYQTLKLWLHRVAHKLGLNKTRQYPQAVLIGPTYAVIVCEWCGAERKVEEL